jgi:hypothetical protein
MKRLRDDYCHEKVLSVQRTSSHRRYILEVHSMLWSALLFTLSNHKPTKYCVQGTQWFRRQETSATGRRPSFSANQTWSIAQGTSVVWPVRWLFSERILECVLSWKSGEVARLGIVGFLPEAGPPTPTADSVHLRSQIMRIAYVLRCFSWSVPG